MKLAVLAVVTLAAFGSVVAIACEQHQASCASGYTWSHEAGACVLKSVSS